MNTKEFVSALSFKAKTTYYAHLYKAIFKKYHQDLIPLIGDHIPDDAVIIDVGGHAGQMAKLFASLAPNGTIYSFEPGLYARSIFEKVIAFKKMKNVELVPVGLSNEKGTATLTIPVKKSGSLGFGRAHVSVESDAANDHIKHDVELITLDHFIAKNAIKRLDFMKVDIEGHEIKMLQGATETLKSLRPVVLMEVVDHFLTQAGGSAQQVWDIFQGLDYDIYLIKDNQLIQQTTPADGDIVCVPKGTSA